MRRADHSSRGFLQTLVCRCLFLILTAQKRGSHEHRWAAAPQKKILKINSDYFLRGNNRSHIYSYRCSNSGLYPVQPVRDLWRVKWHWDRPFSELIWLSFRQCCTLVFIFLLLFDGQGGETWKPSKNSFLFPKRTSVLTEIS